MFGTKSGLESYLRDSPKYKQPSDGSEQELLDIQAKTIAMMAVMQAAEKYGPQHPETKRIFMDQWNNTPAFRNDPNAAKLKGQLGI